MASLSEEYLPQQAKVGPVVFILSRSRVIFGRKNGLKCGCHPLNVGDLAGLLPTSTCCRKM